MVGFTGDAEASLHNISYNPLYWIRRIPLHLSYAKHIKIFKHYFTFSEKQCEEITKLYSAALAFVGFSVQDTFGKVFAEAMLCGTPAIVFNATACPEVVGDTGYAVPPHDVNAMLEKIKEIDENGREYYSQGCKDRVLSNYDCEQNVMKYINIYESIINSKQ